MFTCVPVRVNGWRSEISFLVWFSPSTSWVLGLELRSSDLIEGAFTPWAIPLASSTSAEFCILLNLIHKGFFFSSVPWSWFSFMILTVMLRFEVECSWILRSSACAELFKSGVMDIYKSYVVDISTQSFLLHGLFHLLTLKTSWKVYLVSWFRVGFFFVVVLLFFFFLSFFFFQVLWKPWP